MVSIRGKQRTGMLLDPSPPRPNGNPNKTSKTKSQSDAYINMYLGIRINSNIGVSAPNYLTTSASRSKHVISLGFKRHFMAPIPTPAMHPNLQKCTTLSVAELTETDTVTTTT